MKLLCISLLLLVGCDVPSYSGRPLSIFEISHNNKKTFLKAQTCLLSKDLCTCFANNNVIANFNNCQYFIETPGELKNDKSSN